MRPIRVGLVIGSRPGISETFIKELIKGLEDSNRVKLQVFSSPDKGIIRRIKQLVLCFKSLFFLSRIKRFYAGCPKNTATGKRFKLIYSNLHILTFKGNLDYIHYAFSNLIHGRAHLGSVFNAKTSIGLRGYDITYYPMNHPGTYSAVWPYVNKIQYNSYDLYQWALYWGASSEIPAIRINAAVNDEFISDEFVQKQPNSTISIVSIGRLHWKKGFDYALLTMKEMKDKNISFKYSIYGNGPETEKLRFMIHSLGLEDFVFLKNPIKHNDVVKVFDSADILLAPSIQEGCSNVCLEAQSRGVFCVVSNAEGMNEVVEDNRTGIITPVGDYQALTRAIADYISWPTERKTETANYAIQRIRNHFTRSQQIKEWEGFFLGVDSN